ncbi:MAG: dephospho-CoA kinase [Flavobacterium sp.]|uniref:dephospho-CoA kinase n=1 Tax=Flavobacterium sp. Leaf359 TaxID=1736351 RepID=UPI0006F44BD7|nr:dephospho-CoA kinase [Flavobacterium sp. Leaf359]KQS53341.1 dephospho-CoA kinase [Flavobacterium sp. Leaf359]MBU7570812.1 dephospho-CoA kinase [Flavobacterium sp.]PZO32900.1 MAG: dephospho-CoA kinase [Flavobacteriaceae bacterium]
MTKIIGLTGGIGSGKSSIAKHIESLGIPVYIADTEAKKILDTADVIAKVIALFGNDILENGKIDRKKIAALVFQDPEKLKKYNAIIHPEVYLHFQNWVKQHNNYPLVVKEAAILFESGSYKDCDKIILVTAPKENRIQRVMKRDAVTREAVEQRMSHQWDDETKKSMSDFVIENIELEKAKQSAENIITLLRNQ